MLTACGTGGTVGAGSEQNGLALFQQKCGGCHTLEAAQTQSTIGPNLDHSFAQARSEGFKDSSIRDIVAGQIRNPGQYSTGNKAGVLQANGTTAAEPRLDVAHVVRAVIYMASLPLDANVQFLTVMATKMPFIGRA